MNKKSTWILVAAVLLSAATLATAGDQGRVPRSAFPGAASIDRIERLELDPVDVDRLRAEDAERERGPLPARPRFAEPALTTVSPRTHGTWEDLEDGSRLWRVRIASPGALSLNLGIDRFELPPGARFWVHDPDGAHVQGPYTASERNADGGLWTAVVLGDELVAELQLPPGAADAELEITSVNRGYRFFGEAEALPAIKRGPCNVNVVCPDGDAWRNQIRSVARITVSGIFLCTGQLVNNVAGDETPYLLTAQHCIEQASEAPSVVAYWNYQTAECDQFSGGSLAQSQSGSTFIASSPLPNGSDFTLVELDEVPDPSFNVYYSGWDARDRLPGSTVTLHHPSGDEKSISFDDDPPTVTSYLGNASPGDGNYLRIGDWDVGTTEGGSSGACLFDAATKRCVGTLSGGYAACGNDDPDWYGRLFSQWTGDGTADTRLSDWLDPGNTGALFVDGKNGAGAGSDEIWLVPAVASLPGVPPTDWKSQVGVVNASSAARLVSIYFVENGAPWPGVLLSGPHIVGADESLYLDDPLQPLSPSAGLLYATVDGSGVAVFCRTFTPAPGGGTYGQGQPGVLLQTAGSPTELILPLATSSPNVFRTNVGFAQTSTGSFQVNVKLYSKTGVLLAQKNYSQSAAWRQVNDIFANMGIGSQSVQGGWIRVTLASGSPSSWTTYATVIDERTGDPTYVMPVAP